MGAGSLHKKPTVPQYQEQYLTALPFIYPPQLWNLSINLVSLESDADSEHIGAIKTEHILFSC